MSFYAFHSEQYQNRIIIRCQPGYHPFIFCREIKELAWRHES